MKRRRPAENDSFDMLLDAVTNAFGGILFLAILIILLVGRRTTEQTPPPPTDQSSAVREALALEAHRLRQSLAGLDSALAEQLASKRQLVPDDLAQLLSEIVQLQGKVDKLLEQQAAASTRLAAAGESLSDAQRQQTTLERQLAATEREKATLEQKLVELQRALTRTAEAPRLRLTQKREFPLVVRYGRAYWEYEPTLYRVEKRLHLGHFRVIEEQDELIRITPKPYAGVPLDQELQFVRQLRSELAAIDPADFYVAVGVWDDSFAEFALLRSLLVAWGMEYRLIPVGVGGSIVEAPQEQSLVQ